MNNLKEILNYEIYTKYNNFYIVIPAKDLKNLSFILKDNTLLVLLNQIKCYSIQNIPTNVIESIHHNRVFLVEKLTFIQHAVNLFAID